MERLRPALTKSIALEDFCSFYWLKEELMGFCRELGISPVGSKREISIRIEQFLATGQVLAPVTHARIKKHTRSEPLSLESIITTGYTNSQANRAFFKSVIGPHFHFTTRFMNFCRENPDKRFRDAVAEWYDEQERKKDETYQTEIAPQFQYNQFVRDFMQANPGQPISAAIEAWNSSKHQRQGFKFSR